MKAIFVDLGGTLILNDNGNGILNQKLFDLLKPLKDQFRLVILSDTFYDVSQILADFHLTETFHPVVITNYSATIDKTRPTTYLAVCEKIGTPPANCLLIDNEQIFRQAAQESGVQVVLPADPNLKEFVEDFLGA